ncbi:Glycine zipper 2TM domain-containing protein [Polaromonas sp. OV174]|uniref:glycine zipper 2TM domain-containing protein n=1 Tax=Polaromonas sp. OV174 TaxID=1855300 RepID=UPI0008E7C1A8|nr:glycine zipper 2TM domain-containing protein [Polaromonas sp. OV174]SFB86150.1 Glycine zipper 2TM domain-containing protein [Polaromonas sp. OV174]
MNTSVDNLPPGQQSASSGTKPLWAAVGILGVAVLGMGGTLIYNQRAPAPPTTVAAVTAPQVVTAPPQITAAPQPALSPADDMIEKPVAAPAKPAPAPASVKKVVKPVHKPTPAPSYSEASPAPSYSAPAPVVAAAPVCAVCGAVESVTPVERSSKAPGPGMGAVAGGVLGAVLGNQVGHGGGRTAATILGAVGGGFAGNAIEGKMRKETVYQVGVRMEDGSHRMLELAQAPGVGSRVTVNGASLRTSDGVSYGPKPAPTPTQVNSQPALAPEYQGR